MKPAWQTTEFWITMLTNVFGVLVLLGVITPEQSTQLTQAGGQLAGSLLVILPTISLVISRASTRKAVAVAAIQCAPTVVGEVNAQSLGVPAGTYAANTSALLNSLGV